MVYCGTIDRLRFAADLASGHRVLDIGGQKMPNCDPKSAFAREYAKIQASAADYRIVDYQDTPLVDYRLDFNQQGCAEKLRSIIDDYKPNVILCMETLEHVNYHFEAMNAMAHAVEKYEASVFITVPNNGNWVFNALGWNRDHSIAFFRDIAERFVGRSDLGRFDVKTYGCMQTYVTGWWIVYAMSFFQPFSWGFWITSLTRDVEAKR